MTQHMKSPRDILVAGIGFLLGMVFCYFVLAAKTSQPTRGFVWAAAYGPGAVGTNSLEALKLIWK